MRAAYLYQAINLLIVILMVPLLLRYLDINEYVLWSIFTTFGGITLQFENAIQMVSVREIAREYHSGNASTLQAAIQKAKSAYTTLSASVLVFVLTFGFLYLHYVAREKLGDQGSSEWLIFISAYVINYYFGINNSILLGMARISRFNIIISQTRIINFLCTYFLLKAGFSIMGICLSFIFSVLVSCAIINRAAKKSLNRYLASPEAIFQSDAKFEYSDSSNIIKHTFYMLASFALYKGGFLVATKIFPADVIASYGLALQANTMLSALALVPVQVWLRNLVSAIASGNREQMFHELALTIIIANTIFVAGSVMVAIFGNMLLLLIGTKVALPNNTMLFLIGLAFLVELNIFLFINFLVTAGNYKFVRIYLSSSVIGVVSVIFLTWLSNSSLATLIVFPLCFQLFLCLPMIIRMICKELAITPFIFLSQLIKHISFRP
jgi:hypothetical protein